jgi:uncharacterized protein (TIGR00661 family)
MKILYAIQGTGNGHLTRAKEIVPLLKKMADVDVLISGQQFDLSLPFDVKYKFNGLGFVFGKKGGVDVWNTYLQVNSIRFLREIRNLSLKPYNFVISDFEPVSCWAAQMQNKVCIGLSNQAATLHPKAPRPENTDMLGKMILSHYAPVTKAYGFHFKSFDEQVYTPIIRKEVREIKITNKDHYTVYLPAYDDERIIKNLKQFKDIEWQVFSKHAKKPYTHKNIKIAPPDAALFLKSMASSEGVLCNAGFGTASEALFCNKKLMVIPMKNQYEQHCNAAVLKTMGISVLKSLKKKRKEKMADWLNAKNNIYIDYPDQTIQILDKIIADASSGSMAPLMNGNMHPSELFRQLADGSGVA